MTPRKAALHYQNQKKNPARTADGFDLAFQVEGSVRAMACMVRTEPQGPCEDSWSRDGPQQRDDDPVDKLPHYAQRDAGQVAKNRNSEFLTSPQTAGPAARPGQTGTRLDPAAKTGLRPAAPRHYTGRNVTMEHRKDLHGQQQTADGTRQKRRPDVTFPGATVGSHQKPELVAQAAQDGIQQAAQLGRGDLPPRRLPAAAAPESGYRRRTTHQTRTAVR